MVERPETETLIENLLQACVDYERCERFDAKHRRLDLEEAKQAIRDAIGHAQWPKEPPATGQNYTAGLWSRRNYAAMIEDFAAADTSTVGNSK